MFYFASLYVQDVLGYSPSSWTRVLARDGGDRDRAGSHSRDQVDERRRVR